MRIPSLRSLLASCVFAVSAAFVSATPTLTLQPMDQVTTVGGSASFTLAATVPSDHEGRLAAPNSPTDTTASAGVRNSACGAGVASDSTAVRSIPNRDRRINLLT